jgi:hypothetical protein
VCVCVRVCVCVCVVCVCVVCVHVCGVCAWCVCVHGVWCVCVCGVCVVEVPPLIRVRRLRGCPAIFKKRFGPFFAFGAGSIRIVALKNNSFIFFEVFWGTVHSEM